MRPCEKCNVNPGLCEQKFPTHAWLCPYCMEEEIMDDMIIATFKRWGLIT